MSTCPFCKLEINDSKIDSHVEEHRFQQQRDLDSIRDFGIQKTFALYTCSVCHLQFDFNTQASDKIKAHASFHFEEERKKRQKESEGETRRIERTLYLRSPEVRDRIAQFDQQFFDERSESEVVIVPALSSLAKTHVVVPRKSISVYRKHVNEVQVSRNHSTLRAYLIFFGLCIFILILIANVVSYLAGVHG
ncbi:MAG TPA: hypothetical protein VGS11_05015 [Candidatus Bathyarchaeia archaeon]|nr:hypothetical protein [Candidatus Bathyarchaeia archaeon]